ncbi:MAG: Xaa-Pro peptidase family protein [Muribaculaceae bacterium]|nr:Xaa-Pro peptidase family protein [Muribaculaceae bacterium]MDE7092056.1 Xaa-Pro peptidase family protein [Muribaculaceae bacterium]
MSRSNSTILLSPEELSLRLSHVTKLMKTDGIGSALINDNANIYYLTGRVIDGYLLIDSQSNSMWAFVRRPSNLEGPTTFAIRKPEDIPAILAENGITIGEKVGLERDNSSWSTIHRLSKVFEDREICNIDHVLLAARSVKTPTEIALIAESGIRQTEVYRKIPSLYQPGMTDIDLQIEIERQLRLAGCLGQFRIAGDSMELFMANILVGDNADNPSPYDFAMGGHGAHPSLPVGADGTVIKRGHTVMVDANGNFTGYMTDMTRVFAFGEISDMARRAHECSRKICHTLAEIARPGIEAKYLFEKAIEIVKEEGLEDYFMGHRQHAGFIGHGVGIQINEHPVIAPRSRDILREGNVIALEPKFVIPGTGAVGIENTYVVIADSPMQCLTTAPEEILSL